MIKEKNIGQIFSQTIRQLKFNTVTENTKKSEQFEDDLIENEREIIHYKENILEI